MKRYGIVCLGTLLLFGILGRGAKASFPPKPLAHRVFPASRFSIDRILARPYDSTVPFGASGDRVWATSPQGWAFRDGVQLLYITNLDAFDLDIAADGQSYIVQKATYAPSHVHMVGAPGTLLKATASFTYVIDNAQNPLTPPFVPEKRWTCWSSGHRVDTYTVALGGSRKLTGLDLYFYNDIPRGGGCAPPAQMEVLFYRHGRWVPWGQLLNDLKPDKNTLHFDPPQLAERVQLVFHHRGTNLYTGLYGFDPHYAPETRRHEFRSPLHIEGDKWITQNDVLVAEIRVTNPSTTAHPFSIVMSSDLKSGTDRFVEMRKIDGYPVWLEAVGFDGKSEGVHFTEKIPAKKSRRFLFACALATSLSGAHEKLEAELRSLHPLEQQVMVYQGWFDKNIAYFACSDPLVTKMYYHRWYLLKKNGMNPRMGHLMYRAFSEGRWTSDWYANVISYGAGHQMYEARWLRDPSYCWGHLLTFVSNPRPDGIYPSHVTLQGQQGGQYTDWITSCAWGLNEVHPNKALLKRIAPALERNVQGWQKVYGWDGSPLLVVDSHWWTGMEWQPAFFSFAHYETGGGAGTDPKYMTPLRRVDLTAYNYGNAVAVAKIERLLGRNALAEKMERLAKAIREAVIAKMWDAKDHWFVDLRASDDAPSSALEVIGLYPFAFDLPPAGRGYETVWETALNPNLFWTPWPIASTAKSCPAYSQDGWPVGPGGSVCMWNGPTWPHANSLVMRAMANTLRHYAPCALTRQKFYELFYSFTRAQYKNQNPLYPWTGEFYNGETGQWKTDQRDYFHSTWIDPLISDLIGLVPRSDDVLEIDPLLPDGAWHWWILDGQAYRGHDITIAYDAGGGHIANGFRGFAVYLDGKPILHAAHPVHLRYDMQRHKLLSPP
ncbi:MAG TPA: hypothetical protein VKV29_07115 [Chthonomonas sp.]|uniref:MGH1-like glycoside hydrolase domain-containing protein n=1 Tax=Chthonomonas sp. TaxID=2282153 RepID=UPI002B4B197F|nr:hypothetical protein [Chthonomonas sp.]HLH80037.1 hypothetical protein [Chthonomonas sp.]